MKSSILNRRKVNHWDMHKKDSKVVHCMPYTQFRSNRKRWQCLVMASDQRLNRWFTAISGSESIIATIGIKKTIEVITTNEHLELYDWCTSNPEGVINPKLTTQNINLEDQVAIEVERRLKSLNIGTQHVAQVQQAQLVRFEFCRGPHFSMYYEGHIPHVK